MKQHFLSALLLSTILYSSRSNAQIASGGIPLSHQQTLSANIKNNIFNIESSWEAVQEAYYKGNYNKPTLIAQHVPVNISFPSIRHISVYT